MTMRILALVTDAFGSRGGIAKFNRDLLDSLCAMPECDQVIAFPRTQHELITRLPAGLAFDTGSVGSKQRYALHLARTVPRLGAIDAVVCGHIRLLPFAWAAARVKHAPLVLIVHGVEAWQRQDRGVTNRLVRSVDAFVAVSEHTRDRFAAWARPRTERSYVIPNTIDRTAFTPGERPPHLMERYGLRNRTVLLTVGRLLEQYKGHDEVLELLPRLCADVPDLTYLIVGDGPDRPRLERKAQSLGLQARVVFAGHVPESEKAEHYRLADAFVMPGRGEGFGIVYLEALACGVPVVASSADASKEAVLNGLLGEVANPDDPESIRHAILAALTRARGVVPPELERFSIARFAASWQQVMREVVSRSPAAATEPVVEVA